MSIIDDEGINGYYVNLNCPVWLEDRRIMEW